MTSVKFCQVLALFLLFSQTAAVRRSQSDSNNNLAARAADPPRIDDRGTKVIHGVPVYNYNLAFQPGRSSFLENMKNDTTPGVEHWLVFIQTGVTNARIVELCKASGKKCVAHGETVPFLEYQGSEEDLTNFLGGCKQEVAFVEPDQPVELVPEVPVNKMMTVGIKSTSSWGLERVHTSERTTTGKGVHVYVLDTGVRTTHNDLEDRAIPTLEVTGSGYIQECRGSTNCAVDRQGHGTHCAGTVAGKRFGVAPGATIHGVKVLGDNGQGTSSWTLIALDWVATNGQRPIVVSMSLGSQGANYAEKAGVDKAVQAGVTVVVAAGNSNDDACRYQPAFVPSAITVGATDPGDARADYSNWGRCVKIFAPGTDIKSLSHASDSETAVMSGTSMACPHVSGAVALLLEANPTWTPAQVLDELIKKTEKGVVRGSLLGAPNLFLDVGAGENAGAPAPAPPSFAPAPLPPSFAPPPSFAIPGFPGHGARCPSWSAIPVPDAEGNCHCSIGLRCLVNHHGHWVYCPQNQNARGAITTIHFLPTCTTCGCYQ